MDFAGFVRLKEEKRWKIHGIQVARQGTVVSEYGDCESRYPIYSATKTVTSSAVGIASDEGRFSVDESLYEYIKGVVPATLAQGKRELCKRITIERLVTMSVKGLPFRLEGDDWLEYALASLPDDIDAPEFHYSNIPAYLVAFALQRALSQHLRDYLTPRFFAPLGIIRPEYENDPSGYFYGASGMRLSVKELARIGELYRGGGVYDGERVLSSAWTERATGARIMNREGGYGYFIWRYRDGYRISGKWGQRCIVLPERELAVTYLSDMEDSSGEVTEAVERYCLS